MSRDEVQAIIDEADENGDGKLDYAEFAHMLLNTSEECVRAAKQKASQTSKAASSVRRKSSTSKQRGSVSRRSFDRQRQREDIRMQLFSQSQANAYLREEKSVTESPTPSTARQSISPPPQSHLPPLVAAAITDPENPQPTVVKTEPNQTDTPQPEAPANQEDVESKSKPTEEVVNSLPNPLELKASSLTKLPPLKGAPLPPLLPPIGTITQPNETEDTRSDDAKPSAEEKASLEQPKVSSISGTEPESDQSPNTANATPVNSDKEVSVTNGDKDKPPEDTNADSAKEQSVAAKETEGTDKERQTDHLQNAGGEETTRETVLPVSVVSLPPNKPKNIEVSCIEIAHDTDYLPSY